MVTKEFIIETATKLFMQNGVKTITIDRIVKELHISKRTIYSHFEDKVKDITLLLTYLANTDIQNFITELYLNQSFKNV